MARCIFDPNFEQLPDEIPVFPLADVLMLPGTFLPLNIFEPRYLAMVRDTLASPSRMLGMVQPASIDEPPELVETGCAGRISSFSECGDGRYEIMLFGVCRFHIKQELEAQSGYRRVVPDWSAFNQDLEPQNLSQGFHRNRLLKNTRRFLESRGQMINESHLEPLDDESLVNLIACHCLFPSGARQQLLEATTVSQRADYLIELLQWSSQSVQGGVLH